MSFHPSRTDASLWVATPIGAALCVLADAQKFTVNLGPSLGAKD